ncbi:MAG: hypothetical protein DME42_13175, partial [Verrucomicrobia bacterium]
LTPDTSPQFDLGVDSLEWLNLTLEIAESSGVELSEEATARIETVRDLLREVTEGGEGEAVDPLEKLASAPQVWGICRRIDDGFSRPTMLVISILSRWLRCWAGNICAKRIGLAGLASPLRTR